MLASSFVNGIGGSQIRELEPLPDEGRLVPILGAVFLASGFTALLYEIAWQRLLTLYYGVGAVSLTLIVSVYMLGLGLGAIVGGRLSSVTRRPLLAYALIELGIGGFGALSLPFLDLLGGLTTGRPYPTTLLAMITFLAVPTILMGMTLPLLVTIVHQRLQRFLVTVSWLYFLNTLGASLGAFAASYLFISFIGLSGTVLSAAVLNLMLAAVVYGLFRRRTDGSHPAPPAGVSGDVGDAVPSGNREDSGDRGSGISRSDEPEAGTGPEDAGLGRIAYFVVFTTGFLAIGHELLWFRWIGVLTKASPYAISTSLGVLLLGLALGSYRAGKWHEPSDRANRRRRFFLLQFLVGTIVYINLIGFEFLAQQGPVSRLVRASFGTVLHPTFVLPRMGSSVEFFRDLLGLFDVLLYPLVFVLPAATLLGASFPLISALAPRRPGSEGVTIGSVVFWNTVGTACGGLITGFVLLPRLGTEFTTGLLAGVGILGGLLVPQVGRFSIPLNRRCLGVVFLLMGGAWFLPERGDLYRAIHAPSRFPSGTIVTEGIDAVILTYHRGEHVRTYINGLAHGGRPGHRFHGIALEAIRYRPAPKEILVVGFGTGSFCELALAVPGVQRVTLVEISKALLENLRAVPRIGTLPNDPRVHLVLDDVRRFLQRTDDRYDLVLLDPLRSTTAYSNNVYSSEFFQILERHLEPDGVVLCYLDEPRVLPRTVAHTFPHVRMYDGFCLASPAPLCRDDTTVGTVLENFPPRDRMAVRSTVLPTYLGDTTYIERISEGWPINRDHRPICEYHLALLLRERGGRERTIPRSR